MRVLFGNPTPMQVIDGVRSAAAPLPDDVDEAVTSFTVPDGMGLSEAFIALTHPGQGGWQAHADEHPTWVACDRPVLAQLLADHYDCPTRQLDELEES